MKDMKRDGIRNAMGLLAGLLSVVETLIRAIRNWRSDKPNGSDNPDRSDDPDKSDITDRQNESDGSDQY